MITPNMKTNNKIKISSLIFFVYMCTMIAPPYLQGKAWSVYEALSFVLVIVYMVMIRYVPSKFVKLSILYFVYIVVISWIRQSAAFSINEVIKCAYIIAMLSLIEINSRKNYARTINTLFWICSLVIIIDLVTIVVFPQGIYQVRFNYTELTHHDVEGWFLGTKNMRGLWYDLYLLLFYVKYQQCNKRRDRMIYIFISLLLFYALLRIHSNTSIVSFLVLMMGLLFASYFKKNKDIKIYPYILISAFLVANVLIVFGYTQMFGGVIRTVFGKDLSFSGRTDIWRLVLLQINRNPFFGSGFIGAAASKNILGGAMRTQAHNTVLNVLWIGGLVLLIIFLAIIYESIRNINDSTLSIKLAALFTSLSLWIEMLYESTMDWRSTWVIIYVIYSLIEQKNQLAWRSITEK